MSRLIRVTVSFALIALVGLPLQAQEVKTRKQSGDGSASASADNKMYSFKTATRNERRALLMLDQLLETSKEFEDAHLRIKIQVGIADLLWKRDEPRARNLFEESFQAIDTIKPPDTGSSSPALPQYLASLKTRLRGEVLRTVSRRSSSLAENLTKLIPDAQKDKPETQACMGCGNQSESARHLLQMAVEAIDKDPARAVRLAKEGLAKGIHPGVMSVLHMLRRKAPALSDELFFHALSVARRHVSYLSEVTNALLSYVFPDFGKGIIKPTSGLSASTSPEVITQFLSFAHDVIVKEAGLLQSRQADAASQQANRQIILDYFVGEALLAYFDRHMPAKTAIVRARLDEMIRAVPPVDAAQYLDDFSRERNASEYVNKAQTHTDPYQQQNLYYQAITQALNDRDYDQAMSIIHKLDDESARAFYESRMGHDRTVAAMSKGDFTAAYKYANEMPDLNQRASMLGRIALDMFYKKDKVRATEMLTEAEELFQLSEDGPEKAKAMLELVYASAQIDLNRGIEDLKSAIAAINAADMAAEWVSLKPIVGKKTGGPVIKTEAGLGTLRFEIAFERLARTDFEQSLELAQMINSKEALALAHLALCRIALGY